MIYLNPFPRSITPGNRWRSCKTSIRRVSAVRTIPPRPPANGSNRVLYLAVEACGPACPSNKLARLVLLVSVNRCLANASVVPAVPAPPLPMTPGSAP
jgi:hypothetical protein